MICLLIDTGIPTVEERKTIERLIKMYSPGDHEVHGFLVGELGVPMPLHISLSSSLSLNTEQRYDFLESLRSSIERTDVHVFDVLPHGLEWMPNSTQNRWFLVLQLDRPPEDELKRLLKASNETACSFGQPGLYTSNQPDSDLAHTSGLNETDSERLKISDTSESTSKEGDMTNAPFHVSIAWSLLKPPSELLDQLPPKPQSILSNLRIPVDVVKVKIGNTISTVSLKHVVPRVEL